MATTVTAVALAVIIGHVGSEASEEYVLERLLWPQRFHKTLDIRSFFQQSLFMTIGGPVHKAILEALDVLRRNGLYLGQCRGHMLGTVFFPDTRIIHFRRSKSEQKNVPEPSRNGFWIHVMHNVDAEKHIKLELPRSDAESVEPKNDFYRSIQPVYHLKLEIVPTQRKASPGIFCIDETTTDFIVIINVILSETISIVTFLVAAAVLKHWVLSLYMLVPLVLRTLFIIFSVRREGLMSQKRLERVSANEASSLTRNEIFEIRDSDNRFMVVEGLQPVVTQFFRHYGHPIRERQSHWGGDRLNEVVSLALIFCLLAYFPFGLVMVQWLDESAQCLLLVYQLYASIAMHITRIMGWQGAAGTEECIAKHLSEKRIVWLRGSGGCAVSASLTTHKIMSSVEGKAKVENLVRSVGECEQT